MSSCAGEAAVRSPVGRRAGISDLQYNWRPGGDGGCPEAPSWHSTFKSPLLLNINYVLGRVCVKEGERRCIIAAGTEVGSRTWHRACYLSSTHTLPPPASFLISRHLIGEAQTNKVGLRLNIFLHSLSGSLINVLLPGKIGGSSWTLPSVLWFW